MTAAVEAGAPVQAFRWAEALCMCRHQAEENTCRSVAELCMCRRPSEVELHTYRHLAEPDMCRMAFGTSSRSTFLHTLHTRQKDLVSNRRTIFHPSIDPKDTLHPTVVVVGTVFLPWDTDSDIAYWLDIVHPEGADTGYS